MSALLRFTQKNKKLSCFDFGLGNSYKVVSSLCFYFDPSCITLLCLYPFLAFPFCSLARDYGGCKILAYWIPPASLAFHSLLIGMVSAQSVGLFWRLGSSKSNQEISISGVYFYMGFLALI